MKIKHILETKEFTDIFKSGEKVRGKTLCLYYKKKGNTDDLFVGVAVSKKFVKKSVTRNYIKRLIYSFFRDSDISRDKCLKTVIRVTRKIDKMKKKPLSKEIREELATLTLKAGISK